MHNFKISHARVIIPTARSQEKIPIFVQEMLKTHVKNNKFAYNQAQISLVNSLQMPGQVRSLIL